MVHSWMCYSDYLRWILPPSEGPHFSTQSHRQWWICWNRKTNGNKEKLKETSSFDPPAVLVVQLLTIGHSCLFQLNRVYSSATVIPLQQLLVGHVIWVSSSFSFNSIKWGSNLPGKRRVGVSLPEEAVPVTCAWLHPPLIRKESIYNMADHFSGKAPQSKIFEEEINFSELLGVPFLFCFFGNL